MNFRSMLARDLQSIVLYDEEGKFVGVRRPSSKLPIEINGTKIIIEDAIGSTGLDLKVSFTSQNIHSHIVLGIYAASRSVIFLLFLIRWIQECQLSMQDLVF